MTIEGTAGNKAEGKAEQARNNPALEWLAKVGTAIYGVMYVVVGWLALQIAFGEPAGEASGSGALREIAQQPFGEVILWVATVGFVALAIWKIFEAVVGHKEEDGGKLVFARASSAAKAIVFVVLAVLAFQTVTGSSGGGGSSGDGYTATIMKLPFGPVLVVILGLAIIAYGVYSMYKGLSDKWRKSLEVGGSTGDIGKAITILARTGYASRGFAFGVIGGLFVWAGFTHDADKSGGLDQALLKLRDAPFGQVLLVAVAIGLACYGAFNIAKAWYLRKR